MVRSAHGSDRRGFVYFPVVAQDDDLPQMTRPAHVGKDAWEIRLSEYQTALALYESVIAAIGDRVRHALLPTSDQQRAERVTHDALMIAREALLTLYRHPTTRH